MSPPFPFFCLDLQPHLPLTQDFGAPAACPFASIPSSPECRRAPELLGEMSPPSWGLGGHRASNRHLLFPLPAVCEGGEQPTS